MDKPISIENVNGNVTITIVDGSNNQTNVSVDEFASRIHANCGLRLIFKDTYKDSVKKIDKGWDKGFSFALESIYHGLEYRREEVINEIKKKLENENRVLILGEFGTSKSTLMMEILCDYLKDDYKILCNLGPTDGEIINNAPFIEDTINMLVNSGEKVLVAVDDTHSEKSSLIYPIIRKYWDDDDIIKQGKIKFVLSARVPEFDWVIDRGIFTKESIQSIELLFDDKTKHRLSYFSPQEIKEFIQRYKDFISPSIKDKPIQETAHKIHTYTDGHPIMVRFSVLQNGLENHIKEAYRKYLLENNEPNMNNIDCFLACSLYHISSIKFTDEISNKLNLNPSLKIIDTIIRKKFDSWDTIHPRWDLELIKYMFSLNDFDVGNIKNRLSLIIKKILDVETNPINKLIIINTLYNTIAASKEKYIDIKTVKEILDIDYLEKILEDNVSKSVLFVNIVGIALSELGKYEEAIECYDEAIRINPDYASAYLNKGSALSDLGKKEEAIECYDEAIRIKPDYAAYFNKGIALSELGKKEEAIECYDEAIRIKPDYAEAYLNKGIALSVLGKKEEVIGCYDEAIRINPDYAEAYYGKGNKLIVLGKYEEAIGCHDEAIRINPDYASAYLNKGNALTVLGKYEEAIGCYDEAIRIKPDADAYRGKGYTLSVLGKYEEAIGCYDEAIRINPDYAAYSFKGKTLLVLGKKEEAIECYDEAIRIKPDYAEAYFKKGIVLSELGKKEEAIECYDEAIRIKPDYAEAYLNKGIALSVLGKKEEVIGCYDEAIRINPDYAEAYLYKGIALSDLGKYDEAIECLNKCLGLDDGNNSALLVKAYLLIQLDRKPEAKPLVDSVLLIEPNNELGIVLKNMLL